MAEITKAIIPLAGLATRHLPLYKVLSKELFPLADKPLLQYILEELKASGVKEVVFVVGGNRKIISDYLKRSLQLEKHLEEQKQDDLLETLREIERVCQGVSFSYVPDRPLGDGHAVLQARKFVGDEPCFVVYADDIVESKTPAAMQLEQVFRTFAKPVIALFELPPDKLSSYGIVAPEKIASKLCKIKAIVEKPAKENAPSRLAMAGRRIIYAEVFDYLKKAKPNKRGEISLTETFGQMVKDGTIIYGYQCEGRWWECGNKEEWLKSFVHYAANHPQYGREVRRFIKEEKLV